MRLLNGHRSMTTASGYLLQFLQPLKGNDPHCKLVTKSAANQPRLFEFGILVGVKKGVVEQEIVDLLDHLSLAE